MTRASAAVLIAPNGTPVALFSNVGSSGQNFTSTVLDDAALTSIASGTAPFTGKYQPTGQLSSLVGSNASGTWTLQILNNSQSLSGVLVNWSLNITPQITVTPVNPVNGLTNTFQIGFPIQQLSGTYTIQLGPNILDVFGQGLDTSEGAGLNVIRGQQQNGPTTTVLYTANDNLPKTIPAPDLVGPGVVMLDDRGARQLYRSGRYDVVRSQRAAGPDQPHLPAGPGSLRDTVLQYGPTQPSCGPVIQRCWNWRQDGEFHQYDLR